MIDPLGISCQINNAGIRVGFLTILRTCAPLWRNESLSYIIILKTSQKNYVKIAGSSGSQEQYHVLFFIYACFFPSFAFSHINKHYEIQTDHFSLHSHACPRLPLIPINYLWADHNIFFLISAVK